jgi:transcriptional regulator with XRE-family HTH domain
MLLMDEEIRSRYSNWLNRAFLKWQSSFGKRKTLREFAEFLGLKQSITSHYLNGKYTPSFSNARRISEKLNDFEGMEILGFTASNDHSVLPPDLRRRLEAAEEEVNRALSERGLTGEMPEAEKITIEIFEKWGFKYTEKSTEE